MGAPLSAQASVVSPGTRTGTEAERSCQPTPLALALAAGSDDRKVSPLTAFKLARRWWLQGRRLNLSALAEELDIGRATLMRWVGTKELLLGEILWSLYKATFDQAKARADGCDGLQGVEYLARIYADINLTLMTAVPLRRFLRDDPRFGLQVLTSNVSGLQQRLIRTWAALFEEQIAAGHIAPLMEPEDLAYFIIRIGEGALYSDLICGREPALEPANTAFRLLLSGKEQASRA